jgi:hypothetical protein
MTKIDIEAPLPTERLRAMRTAAVAGVPTSCRIQPVLPSREGDVRDVIRAVGEASGSHVSVEHLKLPIEASWPGTAHLSRALERSLTLAEIADAALELQGVPMGLGDGGGLKTLLREKPLKGLFVTSPVTSTASAGESESDSPLRLPTTMPPRGLDRPSCADVRIAELNDEEGLQITWRLWREPTRSTGSPWSQRSGRPSPRRGGSPLPPGSRSPG